MGKLTDTKVFDCHNATIDISEYPIIHQTIKPVDPNELQCTEYLRTLNQVVDSTKGPFVIITDTSNAIFFNAKARIQIANGIRDLEQRNLERYTMSILVMPNPIFRTLLRGINLFMKPVAPQIVKTNVEEAVLEARRLIGMPF